MNIVSVIGVQSYAYHGCLSEETAIGGEFLTDVVIYTDFKKAAKKDDLSKTINYVDVNTIIEEEMAVRSDLIETVGYSILKRIKKISSSITRVKVEVKKINPPINGNVSYVSITVDE